MSHEQLSIPEDVANYRAEQMAAGHMQDVNAVAEATANYDKSWDKTKAAYGLGTQSLEAVGVQLPAVEEITRGAYEHAGMALRGSGNPTHELIADAMDVAEGEHMTAGENKYKAETKQKVGITSAKMEVADHLDAYTAAAKRAAEADGHKIDLMTTAPSESNTTAEPKSEPTIAAQPSISIDEAGSRAADMVKRQKDAVTEYSKTYLHRSNMRAFPGVKPANLAAAEEAHQTATQAMADARTSAKAEVDASLDAYREAARQDAEAHGKTINL